MVPYDYEFYSPAELSAGLKGDASYQKKNFPPVTRPARNIVDDKQDCSMSSDYSQGKMHSGAVSTRKSKY